MHPIFRLAILALLIADFNSVSYAQSVTSLFPANGATNICPDTTLRISFSGPALLNNSGKIQIFDASNNAVVETIGLATPTGAPATQPGTPAVSRTPAEHAAPALAKLIGGLGNYHYYPVITSGNEAEIFPAPGTLVYGKSYYVTIDAGAIKGTAGVQGASTWRFTTRAAGLVAGLTKLTVAADSSGDFATVQGALDFIPDNNTTPITMLIKKGLYREMNYVSNKHSITLIGEDRTQTVIAYATNDRFNNSAGGGGYRRGVFRANRCNDLVLTNLTIRNTTPQGGTQAEAIIFNGTTTARTIVTGVDLYSYQDTLQINGQAYISNSYIEGDVDFMWGSGPCFFENCECKSLRSNAYYTQIRNPATNHGYVYSHCTFDGIQGIMGNYLARIAPRTFPASEVVLLDCTLTTAISPVAWKLDQSSEAPNVHFLEFNSHDRDGKPVDVSQRLNVSKQLKQPDDAATIANFSNPAWVLGNDWNPMTAPIFASSLPKAAAMFAVEPASQIALLGTNAGIYFLSKNPGSATFQWNRNGRPIPGATSPILRLQNIGWDDAASYTVTINDGVNPITSNAATLTVVAPQSSPAPQLPTIAQRIFDITANGAIGDGASDNTAAIQKTIDAAVAAGGGIVQFPASIKLYLSGPLTLGSGVDFHLDAGAVLQALPYSSENKPGSYPLRGNSYANFISCNNAHDVAMTGAGTIDGQGPAWWAAFRANRNLPHRPYLIRMSGCSNVLVSGLNFVNSPMFHVAISGTNNLTIFGISIHASESGPNTDGIDPSGSHHLIQNCYVSVGDDNVVMKPGGAFCSDITVADCEFGAGHGMSVGGQSNRGLDGMTIRNISFNGTTTGLRLKADATQGGPVQNITYSNLVMNNVPYPIVFYSYYNKVGNPGVASGNNQSTPARAEEWNKNPPNPLNTTTLPSWKNITINNLLATNTKGYNVIWGLPLSGYFFENVKLNNVRIPGSLGFEIYNAANVQITGDSDVGPLLTNNALVIAKQPTSISAATGSSATFSVTTAGTSSINKKPPTFQWTHDGKPLTDGTTSSGSTISGATSATLKIGGVQSTDTGSYGVTISNSLDAYDVTANSLTPEKTAAVTNSGTAELTIRP